ncbi:hypothetical protein [Geothrix sp. 21YS21S-4]|uniref:hypothetical protein n=1 Tax=Geothrix sp. 21YS21S-4 TaxID=3068889 RepID=UPI0027B8BFE5|nr:hypothetical protein [Geothrix sp. 21YS21S-4]
MRVPYVASVRALLEPGHAFAGAPPRLGPAVGSMLAAWFPPALLDAGLTLAGGLRMYGALRKEGPPEWMAAALGTDPAEVKALLASLPGAPPFARLAPWLLLAVPLLLLGTWLHHAAWDHLGLWILRGTKGGRGFRVTLGAEAEALRIGAVGSVAGLLAFLPGAGLLLGLPLMVLTGYLWIFRGWALAARHGCEPWRGIGATVVHAVLLGLFGGAFALFVLVLLRAGA